MGFLVFFIKRALATIPLLFAITVVAFTLLQAMPGDYADQWKNQTMMLGGISEEEAAKIRKACEYAWIKGKVGIR